MLRHSILVPVLSAVLLLTAALPVCGTVYQWNRATDGVWRASLNWTPPTGPPGVGDDVNIGTIIGTFGTRVTLNHDEDAATLRMFNGNDLDTDGFELLIAGRADLADTGTTLLVKPNNIDPLDAFDADQLFVSLGATVKMLGGELDIDGTVGTGLLDVDSASTIIGFGTIDLVDSVAATTDLLIIDGTLSAGNTGDGVLPTFDVARTLSIDASDADARASFAPGATVNVLAAGTLDINLPARGTFPIASTIYSTINLSRKSTLDIEDAWRFAGTMNVNTQAGPFVGQTAGCATLAGGDITMTGGSINFDHVDDCLILDLDSAFTTTGGTISFDAGKLQFDSTGNIGSGTDFANGADDTELVLNASLTVNDADWNWDGDGGSDNIITINETGHLSAHIVSPTADQSWSGVMNINGGSLWVQADGNDWSNGNVINIGGTVVSTIAGDEMTNSSAGSSVNVATNAKLDMSADNVWDAGTFVIDGEAALNGDITWAGTSVSGSGVLFQNRDATVTQDTTIGVDRFDMDGIIGSAIDITIDPGVTWTVDSTSIETFNGQLNVNSSTLDVNTSNWEVGSGGSVNLANTGSGGGTLAEGGTLTVLTGGQVTAEGSANLIDTDVVFEEGSQLLVLGGGEVTLGIGTNITLDGGDFNEDVNGGLVRNNGTLLVTGASAVNVTTFDWDQGPTIVESTGNLDINVDVIDASSISEKYDDILTINGGVVSVDNAANVWIHDGTISFNSGGSLGGDAIRFGDDTGTHDSHLNVSGTGVATITASTTFLSDAGVLVNGGATLRTTGTTNFEPVNGGANGEFTGTGTWQLAGTNNIDEETTIDMVGGTVDLDNSSLPFVLFANDTNVDADLNINVGTLADYGRFSPGTPPIIPPSSSELNIADTATLTVNLDTASEWTVNSVGIINYAGDASANSFLAGSPVNIEGTLNVDGDGQSDARLNIEGTVNINTAGEGFRFGGGNTTTAPNRLVGGRINGPGPLRHHRGTFPIPPPLRALHGYGTINAEIIFESFSDLKADDGILNVFGDITSVRVLGTADDDGILNVVQAVGSWNTNVATLVDLNGGELRGHTIVNDDASGINGDGLVTARVINNTRIDAENGGTLRLTNTGNDWDGTSEAGQLNALTGNLELVDVPGSSFGYSATATIETGRTLFIEGFNLDFDSGSQIVIRGGRLRSDATQTIAGSVSVEVGPSRFDTNSIIQSAASVELGQDLLLEGDTVVQAGVTFFSSGGSLINTTGNVLTANDGVSFGNVPLENRGTMVLGASPGQIVGFEFEQIASGTLEIELAGTGLNDFDRMSLTGLAQLAGAVEVSTIGGFNPELNDVFTIISAPGGRVGTFAPEDFSAAPLDPGLAWDVLYNPTNVQLIVISGSTLDCDFDGSGTCDITDLDLMYGGIAVNDLMFDIDGSGTTDNADITEWLVQAGDENELTYLPGDTDLDGSVIGNDFTTLAANFGQFPRNWGAGNFDGNNGGTFLVGGSDFTSLASNFGFTSLSGVASVPEPGLTPLLGMALLGVLLLTGIRGRRTP